MPDDFEERLARIERAIDDLAKRTTEQHAAVTDELKMQIYDLHRHAHAAASADSAAYMTQSMQGVPRFDDVHALFGHTAALAGAIDGDVLEFGVAGGKSLKRLGELLPDRRLFGFDSFEGLPEGWALNVMKGAYAIPVEKAKHIPARAVLVHGWFNESLPPFMAAYDGAVAFLHVDCDLYSSTFTVLEHLAPLIRPGCVIQFDEYFNYAGWRDHEFKAWQEFVAARGVRYEYVGYTRRAKAVAVRVLGEE